MRRSVKAHYLKSYQAALTGVLRSQFSPLKAFPDGYRGALTLADDPQIFLYLCSTGWHTLMSCLLLGFTHFQLLQRRNL